MNWLINLLSFWKRWEQGYEDFLMPPEPLKTAPVVPETPLPINAVPMPIDPDSIVYPWDTPEHNYHNVRVICDKAGLTLQQKNILCQCVYQESQFFNYEPDGLPVKYENKDSSGTIWSTDWGIAEVNDYWQIGSGKTFPSVDYVMQNPDAVIKWMAGIYKTTGTLQPWSSYTSGAYKKWGLPNSPMWKLKS